MPHICFLAIGQLFNGVNIGGVYKNKSLVQLYTQLNSKWVYSQSVTLAPPYEYDYIGSSIAFSSDSQRLALSSSGTLVNGKTLNGVVQIFNRNNSAWSWSQTILPEDLASNGYFGNSLLFSPDGSLLVVSELNYQLNSVTSDVVHLFKNINNIWSKTQLLTSDVPSVANIFGSSTIAFSVNSQSLYIGEPDADLEGLINSGKVHVFNKIENLWIPKQVILSQHPALGFGSSISINADDKIMVVGELSRGASEGAVYLYKRTGNNWVHIKKLLKPNLSDYLALGLVFSPVSSE